MGLPGGTEVLRGTSVEERKGLARTWTGRPGQSKESRIAELFETCSWVGGDIIGL